jgi:hypothetical protein
MGDQKGSNERKRITLRKTNAQGKSLLNGSQSLEGKDGPTPMLVNPISPVRLGSQASYHSIPMPEIDLSFKRIYKLMEYYSLITQKEWREVDRKFRLTLSRVDYGLAFAREEAALSELFPGIGPDKLHPSYNQDPDIYSRAYTASIISSRAVLVESKISKEDYALLTYPITHILEKIDSVTLEYLETERKKLSKLKKSLKDDSEKLLAKPIATEAELDIVKDEAFNSFYSKTFEMLRTKLHGSSGEHDQHCTIETEGADKVSYKFNPSGSECVNDLTIESAIKELENIRRERSKAPSSKQN